jgi:hypothetical protein
MVDPDSPDCCGGFNGRVACDYLSGDSLPLSYDRSMTFLRCKDCGTVQPLFSKLIRDPYSMACVTENFNRKHARCSQFKTPGRALAEIQWDKMVANIKKHNVLQFPSPRIVRSYG